MVVGKLATVRTVAKLEGVVVCVLYNNVASILALVAVQQSRGQRLFALFLHKLVPVEKSAEGAQGQQKKA